MTQKSQVNRKRGRPRTFTEAEIIQRNRAACARWAKANMPKVRARVNRWRDANRARVRAQEQARRRAQRAAGQITLPGMSAL